MRSLKRETPALPGRLEQFDYRLSMQMITPDGEASSPMALGQFNVAGQAHGFDLPAQMDGRSGARFGDFAQLLGYRWEEADALNAGPVSAFNLNLVLASGGRQRVPVHGLHATA